MLIIGAGGFALQLFDELVARKDIVFWSETATKYPCLSEHFRILHTDAEAAIYFSKNPNYFITGIWSIPDRRRLTEKFIALGGEPTSLISSTTHLSSYASVGKGSVVLFETAAEPYVSIGENCLVNKKVSFGHGARVSPYCSIGPHVIVGSDVEIGEGSYIGMAAIIQPKVKIGRNAVIAAGAVLSKNVEENAVVAGNPARVRFLQKPIKVR